MKRLSQSILLLLVSAACLTAMQSGEPPEPKVPRFGVTLTVAGTNVWAKWIIAANPSDSLTVDVSATGQTSLHKMYALNAKTDSVSYPKPAPGGSITVSVLGKNWRVGKSAAAPLASQTYVEPDTIVTPPSVQLFVTPTSTTLAPGGTQQFTATVIQS